MVAHSRIALLLVAFKHECVHLRLHEIDGLVAPKVVLSLPPEILDFPLDLVDFCIDLFEIRTELRINDIVVLFGFSDINALLKHLFQLGEVLEGPFKLIKDLSAQWVMLIHHVLIQVSTQLLQCEYHVINLYTVH